MKKAFFILLSAIFLPGLSMAAVLTTPLTVDSAYPVGGSSAKVSGSCGPGAANTTVNFSLVQGSSTTTLTGFGNITADASGAFNGTLTYPTSFGSGPAALIATCATTGDAIYSNNLIFAAPTSTSFNLGGITPNVGGLTALSGACGPSNGSGTVQINIFNNGATTTLGTINLANTGTFNSPLPIPVSSVTGPATIVAMCSNGASFSTSVNLGSATVNSFTLNPNVTAGTNASVSGTCSGLSGNTNGTATFSLLRNGVTTTLISANPTTNTGGMFNSTITYPIGYGTGPASLVVTCPSGSTYASPITITDTGTPTGTGLSGGLAFPGGATTGAPPTANVAGASTSTPVGGVNAGTPYNDEKSSIIMAALLILVGMGGLVLSKRIEDAR